MTGEIEAACEAIGIPSTVKLKTFNGILEARVFPIDMPDTHWRWASPVREENKDNLIEDISCLYKKWYSGAVRK